MMFNSCWFERIKLLFIYCYF